MYMCAALLSDLQFVGIVEGSLSIAVEGCLVCSVVQQVLDTLHTPCTGCLMEGSSPTVCTLRYTTESSGGRGRLCSMVYMERVTVSEVEGGS